MKICFPNPVKYNGVNYNANTPFNVQEEDIAELKKKGGWVVEKPVSQKKTTTTTKTKKVSKE